MMEITYKLQQYDKSTWVLEVTLFRDGNRFQYKTPLMSREQALDASFIHTSIVDLERRLLEYARQTMQS